MPQQSPPSPHALLLLLLPLLTTPLASAYLGPTPCTTQKPSLLHPTPTGYSTFSHLLYDLTSLSTTFHHGQPIPDSRLTFTLCPGSIIDLDDSTLPLSFLPLSVPRLTLQCGPDGKRRPDNPCLIRGGGKRDPRHSNWNTDPASSYKQGGHAILGGGNVAQIYVFGDDAYEVTLRGLTLDNSVSGGEVKMYGAFVQKFVVEAVRGSGEDDDVLSMDGGSNAGGAADNAGASTTGTNTATASDASNFHQILQPNASTSSAISYITNDENHPSGNRTLQTVSSFDTSSPITQEKVDAMDNIQPARRYASIAVRGGGYGDDPGPRIITIEDCAFVNHRGYAILVSPGIQRPEMPVAPQVDLSVAQSPTSGKPHNYGNTGSNMNGGTRRRRRLDLLEGNAKYISRDGTIKYYDTSATMNYLDGRRVKIANSEFTDNNAMGNQIAGLITSAYSLTLSNCKFTNNSAKTMVYVYNNHALIENTVFTQNTVQASTVVLKSPVDSKPKITDDPPTHLVERCCFLGSKVGMSNVLVTDVVNTGFGQRDNHATGTVFSWDSQCQGGAAEKSGEDCLESGVCDGTCVEFTAERCLAENVDISNQQDFGKLFQWSGGIGIGGGVGFGFVWRLVLGAVVLVGI
ncbi:hypothetical protein HJC23_008462 [Cyclotella cryptica]|uniref:Right handed beta helix domain-containing protein n=1 Tax=Cyclotella cryptica TaxID=29204 RepID=A0ABD3QWJ5_9STRA|eukprot:CCRYP_001186-RB/>CCRYP_001186-RB protein AED:0.01 eAED:0.01 QI:293/-1/1/1/-1/1/1/322/629